MTERTPRKNRGPPGHHPASEESDDALFRRAVGPVRRVTTDRVAPHRTVPQAKPRPRIPASEPEPEPDVFTDALEPTLAGQRLLYHRAGVQSRLIRKLRRGQITIAAELDLHGHLAAQAEAALSSFLRDCQDHHYRCVRIIHGKGLSSPGGRPVIKSLLNRWLREHPAVLAFCSARTADGGTGALYVLLMQH